MEGEYEGESYLKKDLKNTSVPIEIDWVVRAVEHKKCPAHGRCGLFRNPFV
jgi:hypothetical protein